MTSQDKDDDFSSMLAKVRSASDAGVPAPKGSREAPPPPRKESRGIVHLSTGGMIAIAVLIVLGVSGIVSLSTWIARRMVAQGASADLPSLRVRLRQQQRLRSYRVAMDSTITAAEAGRILHAIGKAGYEGPLRQWEQPPAEEFAACCTNRFREVIQVFGPSNSWTVAAIRAARRGLAAKERELLRDLSRNPALGAFRRVAHARDADIAGAVWSVPADTLVSWADLPSIRSTGLRAAMSSNIAAAALDLADGHAANAELRLRESLSVGFLLSAGARSYNEEATASAMVQSTRNALEAFYLAMGRSEDAARVSAKSDEKIPVSNANRRVSVSELEATLERRIRDTTELVGIRWQLLLGPYAYLPCGSVVTAIFGPSARQRAALDEIHASLVKYPSDAQRATFLVRGIPQMIDPNAGFRPRNTERPAWAAFISRVTRSSQLERCSWMFRR